LKAGEVLERDHVCNVRTPLLPAWGAARLLLASLPAQQPPPRQFLLPHPASFCAQPWQIASFLCMWMFP